MLLLLLLQLGVGFNLLLSKGPGSPEVLPCSAWAICGVVGEHTHVCAQGHSVAGFVREHKHVCSKACDSHDVAAATQFWPWLLLLLLLLLQLGVGFKLLLRRCPGSPQVLPCSAWAICGVCAQKHIVAGSGSVVSFVLLLFYGQVEKTP